MKSAADRRRKCRPLAMTMSESQFVISTPITTSTIQSNLIYDQWQWHPAVRFTISGILGNAVFWGLDRMLFPLIVRTTTASVRLKRTVASMPNNKFVLIGGGVSTWINNNAASVSFFVAYLLDIAIQHFLNAWIVFGFHTIGTRELYFLSLATSYTAYFGTLCGSTILQAYLLHHGTSKTIAFWSVIALGSMVNYVVLTSLNEVREHRDATHKQTKMAMVVSKIWKSRSGSNT